MVRLLEIVSPAFRGEELKTIYEEGMPEVVQELTEFGIRRDREAKRLGREVK